MQEQPKLLPNSNPRVYELDCRCNGKYIGESRKKVLTHNIDHKKDSITGHWNASEDTEYTKDFHRQFHWLNHKALAISSYMQERKVFEALEIYKLGTLNERDTTFKVPNRDRGDYVSTNPWKLFLMKMGNH